MNTLTTPEKDRRYVGRDTPAIPLDVARADGSIIYDARGKEYIDFVMGWCVGNLGWTKDVITKRLQEFTGPTYVQPPFLYKPWADLAEHLAEITPGKLTKSFRATGGTEAVEIALQAAMAATKRTTFISVEGSYHGHSIGAMSVGSSEFRNVYANLLPNCKKISPPLDTKAARQVEEWISRGDVAAYISEPTICNLGVEIPDAEYYAIVQRACKEHGTLFIMDEVATGFGRTGKLFASEHYELEPDIMCLAKGITGGFGALGATIMTDTLARAMEFDFSFYSTFGWHPLNVEAALANVEYWIAHKDALLKNVQQMSKIIEERLRALPFSSGTRLRIQGLAIGVSFEKQGYAEELKTRARENGLLLSTANASSIVMYPALDIDEDTLHRGLDLLEKSLS